MFKQITILPPRVTLAGDETLFHGVRRALDRVEPLRVSRLPVLIQVHDGVVTLTGAIGSAATKTQTLRAARGVPGIRRVRDELLTDSELQVRVASALAEDAHTRPAAGSIVVHVYNGWVTLAGRVADPATAQAAQAVAAHQPGVRGVANRLQVRLN